jgi:hypothetical protein
MHIYDIADHHTIFKHLNLRSFEKKVNSLPKGLQNLKCFETEILIYMEMKSCLYTLIFFVTPAMAK